MLSLLILGLLTGGGWQLAKLLPWRLTRTEQLAAGLVMGVILTAGVGFWLILGLGYALGLTLIVLLWLGLTAWIGLAPGATKLVQEPEPWPVTRWGKLMGLLLVLLGAVIVGQMVYSHFLPLGADGGLYSGGYTWSDLALHLTLASRFAYQSSISLAMPIYAPGTLSYPFLSDFFSSLLLRLDSPTAAFYWPTLGLVFALLRLSWGLVYRLTGSLKASLFHLLLYLGAGSWYGGWYYLQEAWQSGYLVYLDRDYSQLAVASGVYQVKDQLFANTVTSSLLPQRSLLLAICVAMLLLLGLWQILQAKPKLQKLSWGWVLPGTWLGLLPLTHVHSYLVMVGVLGVGLVWLLIKRQVSHPLWIILGVGLLLGLPQLGWQLQSSYSAGFGHFQLGWMTAKGASIALFWWRNLGLNLLLLLPALYYVWCSKQPLLAILTVSGLGIALAANLYIFQPNPWDNMKFLTYALYFLSLPVAYMLSRWWKRAWPAVLLLLASLTLSGGLAIGRDLHLNYPVVTGTDLTIAAKVRQLLPEDALVVTTDRHNNPIPVLTGRRVLMGYPGWLWSYGIDYQPLALEVKQIFSGGSQADRLIAKHGITHLILAEKDAASVGFNLSYYQTHYQLQYQGDGWWIFNLRSALSQPLAPF